MVIVITGPGRQKKTLPTPLRNRIVDFYKAAIHTIRRRLVSYLKQEKAIRIFLTTWHIQQVPSYRANPERHFSSYSNLKRAAHSLLCYLKQCYIHKKKIRPGTMEQDPRAVNKLTKTRQWVEFKIKLTQSF